jgi:hypothetical protein
MDEMKRAWDEVGDGFSTLGRMISERYRDQDEGKAEPGRAPQENAVGDAIRRATEELDKAFTSLGDTLRDDAAQEQMRQTGRKLTDALKVTFTEVGDEIRRAVGNRRSDGPNEPPAAGSGDPA